MIAGQSEHGFAWYTGEPDNDNALLSGKKIGTAYATAGFVEIPVEDMHLLFHDGINIRYLNENDPLPKKTSFTL